MGFLDNFKAVFKTQTHDSNELASMYTGGLFTSEKGNIERIEESVPAVNYEQLRQFISKSPWCHNQLMTEIALRANRKLKDYSNKSELPIGFYIDESSFVKKGMHSVGVSRQWLGCRGKVDNGQVAVFSSLGCGAYNSLIDCRLFLPECWTEDKERCNRAGIPEDEQEFKTKIELAIESVMEARTQGIVYDFIAVDALYGSSFKFINTLDQLGEVVMGRMRNSIHVYLEEPLFQLPERESNKGRKPTKLRAQTLGVTVKSIAESIKENLWEDIDIRSTTKGILKVQAFQKKVWLHDDESGEVKQWDLIICRDNQTTSLKDYTYTISNTASSKTLREMIQMDRQRYWIERSFQDNKNEVAMDEYQVRKYRGFYHHMSLCMLATLFLMEERMDCKDTLPLLSCADIRRAMEFLMPKKVTNLEEFCIQMEIRHIKRQKSIDHASRDAIPH